MGGQSGGGDERVYHIRIKIMIKNTKNCIEVGVSMARFENLCACLS